MLQPQENPAKDDLKIEYDFTKMGKAVEGKYAEIYRQGINIIVLDSCSQAALDYPSSQIIATNDDC
ncbi:MAG: hypothetical protein R2865_15230 [Deinococcales bacterium]